ncbi:MAG: hypothetical protein QOK89_00830 [Nitrososphaeraceae archaeon]|jgi:hypothetical protein|nr:hypothetical protein [Nitrososphaeraceae archaeon]MDW3611433.1 hypothetical protein [Nitrososphaeraceae archaeon]MDW3626170.1 hypothetical protein [Nitrososphaeraceae archaeon]
MSLEEKIFDKIFSSGVSGLKKTDLTKEFASVNLDNILNTWIKQNKIIVSKKGSTNYCWHKDSYFQYLVDSDPKFKYTLELLKEVQISFQNLSTSIDKHVEKLEGKMIVLMDSILATTTNSHTFENSIPNPQKVINLQSFSEDFDLTICKYSDSIGWVPLATLRNDLSNKYEISEKEFYDLAEQLVNENRSKYELSTGGNEGIMIRGLVYGYVRCL